MRLRTIEQAAWLRESDPETCLTQTAIRRLVVSGRLPHVRVGQKYLVDIDALEANLFGCDAENPCGKIASAIERSEVER